jgi:hypothetical protein
LARLISFAALASSFLAWAILPSARSFLAFFSSCLAWAFSFAGFLMAALTAFTPAFVVCIVIAPLVSAGMVADPAASGVAASMAMSRGDVFLPGVGMKPAAAVTAHENELGGRSQETGKVRVDRSSIERVVGTVRRTGRRRR